jgi:predicted RNase H-like HicB family nuclease
MVRPTTLARAEWDPEAGVFVATSDDVPGLVAETATSDALRKKLEVLVSELLELNGRVTSRIPSFLLMQG